MKSIVKLPIGIEDFEEIRTERERLQRYSDKDKTYLHGNRDRAQILGKPV